MINNTINFADVSMTREEKRRMVIREMVSMGQQIPLNKVMTGGDIFKLKVTTHAINRYRKRFKKLYPIQIESEIKGVLCANSMIVDIGHSDRWLVFAKGFIFVLDKECVYTVYDCNGQDRNNILDDTKAQMAHIQRKTKHIDRIEKIFELAQVAAN